MARRFDGEPIEEDLLIEDEELDMIGHFLVYTFIEGSSPDKEEFCSYIYKNSTILWH